MATLAWREQAETSLDLNSMFGLYNMTAFLRILEIIVGDICLHFPVSVMTRDRGLEGVALLSLRWSMRQSGEDVGHSSGSPEDF